MADTTAELSADTIDVSVPVQPAHAATLRILVTSIGADAGLSVDDIDDLKLAVSEVFTLLADDAAGVGATRAHASIIPLDRGVSVHLHRGITDDELVLDELAATILATVVDEHHVRPDGITLVKRSESH